MKQHKYLPNWLTKIMVAVLTSALFFILVDISNELVAVSWN